MEERKSKALEWANMKDNWDKSMQQIRFQKHCCAYCCAWLKSFLFVVQQVCMTVYNFDDPVEPSLDSLAPAWCDFISLRQ